MTLDVGQVYQATLTIANQASPPATVTLAVTTPDQAVTTPPVGPGAASGANWVITYNYTTVQAGLHKFAWATTGPGTATTDFVNVRSFASAISLADARERLGLAANATSDQKIRTLMASATREVEKITGTLVPRVFTDDWIPGTTRDVLRLPHGPALNAAAVTSLRSAYPQGPSWDPASLVVNLRPGTIRHAGLIPFWYGPWLATYTGGVTEVAEPVAEAVREVLYDLWQQMRGVASGVLPGAAAEEIPVPAQYYRLPPVALAALRGYEMPGFG